MAVRVPRSGAAVIDVKIKLLGADEMKRAVERIGKQGVVIASRAACRASAEVLVGAIKANIPIGEQHYGKQARTHVRGSMRSHVRVFGAHDRPGWININAGIDAPRTDKSALFYAPWVEWGHKWGKRGARKKTRAVRREASRLRTVRKRIEGRKTLRQQDIEHLREHGWSTILPSPEAIKSRESQLRNLASRARKMEIAQRKWVPGKLYATTAFNSAKSSAMAAFVSEFRNQIEAIAARSGSHVG